MKTTQKSLAMVAAATMLLGTGLVGILSANADDSQFWGKLML
ncbi:MAG: hypothetical protein SAL70_42695 [Scytonema sp. PMC 1070.18]|nr:hypothetical protein [Scytonema sp. PMC 1070.18]